MYPGHPSETRLCCPAAGICLWVFVHHNLTLRADFHLYVSLEALLGDAEDWGLLGSDCAVGLVCSLATPHSIICNPYLLASMVTVSVTEQVVQYCWDLLSLVYGVCGQMAGVLSPALPALSGCSASEKLLGWTGYLCSWLFLHQSSSPESSMSSEVVLSLLSHELRLASNSLK